MRQASARRAATPPPTPPPMAAAEVVLLLPEEDAGRASGAAPVVEVGGGEGVLGMMEVMRMMEVWPLGLEAVEERVTVAEEAGGGARRVVAGFGGREIEGRAGLAGMEIEGRTGLAGGLRVAGLLLLLASLPWLALLSLLELALLEPVVASAGPPRDAIVAVGLPRGRTKKGVSSLRLQQTLEASRFWSQQYWPPRLEHCCTAWLPESLLSVVLGSARRWMRAKIRRGVGSYCRYRSLDMLMISNFCRYRCSGRSTSHYLDSKGRCPGTANSGDNRQRLRRTNRGHRFWRRRRWGSNIVARRRRQKRR